MEQGIDRAWRSWREAATEALYGERGFFRAAGGPAAHFRTSAHASPLWARAVQRLAERVDDALGRPDPFLVVDMGAGGGELLAGLAGRAPARWELRGVDLAARPPALPGRVRWAGELPAGVVGVVLANEWLDDVPLDVVTLGGDGPRLVQVDHGGRERLGPPPGAEDLAWVRRWWPLTAEGDRAEVGRTRDAAWATVIATLSRGVAVAVDYAVDPAACPAGTLTGYRDGRQVAPVPDGSCDLTAHVVLASCAAAGAAAGATATRLATQREALQALGVTGRRPAYDLARSDPAGYLAALRRAGEAAELTDPAGLGGFTWLLQARGCPLPL